MPIVVCPVCGRKDVLEYQCGIVGHLPNMQTFQELPPEFTFVAPVRREKRLSAENTVPQLLESHALELPTEFVFPTQQPRVRYRASDRRVWVPQPSLRRANLRGVHAPHGTPNKYMSGCRCPECLEAHRIRIQQFRQRVKEENRTPPTHGTVHSYRQYACRCDECREATRAYEKERRRK